MSACKHFVNMCKTASYLYVLPSIIKRSYYIKPTYFNKLECIVKPFYPYSNLKTNSGTRTFQFVNVRWKSGKGKSFQSDEDSDDSDNEDNEKGVKGAEVKTSAVTSMRTDLILKVGLGLSRIKVEKAFYESKIRVNAKKTVKKSSSVRIGDEIDLIKGISPNNPDFLIVGRVEILNARGRSEGDGIDVKYRRSKSLVIENYPEGDPWKSETVNS